jgi:CubicO group peptidase (beta-lactamase class C family)
MQLVEEGRLDLDRDVNNYLDFRIPDAFGKPITMRHLMTHTPGFAERYRGIYEPDATTPLGQQLRGNIPARVYPPGSTMAYTNYGTALAGYIVERLRGRPFETLVQERIFAPVGMVRSSFGRPPPAPLARQLVSGYKPGSREAYRFEVLGGAPAGALSATGGDMGRFLLMLMNGGQGANGRVLSPAGVQRMMEVAHRPVPMEQSGFGLGMIVSEQRGVRTAGHGGNLTTTATDLVMFPQHRLRLASGVQRPGQRECGDQSAGEPGPGGDRALHCAAAPVVTATGPSTASDLAGKWLSTRRLHSGPLSAGSALSLVTARAERDGTLRLSNALYPDGSERRWLPAGRDRFREQETGAWLVAKRDGSGKVVRFASPLVYPVAEFDRATGLVASAVSLFWAAFAVLLIAALAGPARWALRRAYGVQPTPHRGAARTSFVAGRAAIWIILLTLAGWAGVMIKVQGDFQSMFGMRAVFVALALASWLSVLAALAVAADAVLAWRDPARGLPRRVGAALAALGRDRLGGAFRLLRPHLLLDRLVRRGEGRRFKRWMQRHPVDLRFGSNGRTVAFPQLPLQHLADRAARQRVHQDQVGQALRLAEPGIHPLLERRGFGLRSRPRHHEGDRGFSPSLGRHAHHRRFDDLAFGGELRLDVARIDIEPARDDEVLLAVHQRQEPVLVEAPDIAGADEAEALGRGPFRLARLSGWL